MCSLVECRGLKSKASTLIIVVSFSVSDGVFAYNMYSTQ